jgi:hypothetical protein
MLSGKQEGAMPRFEEQPFSCENPHGRFHTDVTRGFPHRPASDTFGSALPRPLYRDDERSLWLEHVIDTHTNGGWEPFWLMWYDHDGNPETPASAVFDRDNLRELVRQLADFIVVP